VQHPTSQGASDTGTVTVLSYNSIATPVSGLEQLEVLLDGAAAIYARDGGVILTSGVLAGGTEANRFRADLRAVYQYY
ncbi:hypothetical protein VSS86_23365, partial [Bacillus safensis]|uniref:hypothetical protein n=1 Tax=Bacillus safensis TaxID=561879 RepID=UPI002DD44B48